MKEVRLAKRPPDVQKQIDAAVARDIKRAVEDERQLCADIADRIRVRLLKMDAPLPNQWTVAGIIRELISQRGKDKTVVSLEQLDGFTQVASPE